MEKPASAGHGCTLGVAAVFQNEAPWLAEWLEYHALLGVERFYLYNNFSTDNYLQILAPYVERGLVELIDWPHRSVGAYDEFQCEAYRAAIARADGAVQWLALIDIDEFVVPIAHEGLASLLAECASNEEIGGVCIAWVFFGTSHVQRIRHDELLIESLVLNGGRVGPERSFPWEDGAYKSIVRPECVASLDSPHFARYKPGRRQAELPYEKVQLNHYWTRDEAFFNEVKIPRKSGWGISTEMARAWAQEMNRETPFGLHIRRFIPALKRRIARLGHETP
jgi:hypothetical protein